MSPFSFTYISSRYHRQCRKTRVRLTRRQQMSPADIGPNLF